MNVKLTGAERDGLAIPDSLAQTLAKPSLSRTVILGPVPGK